jgi:hypothetical protein
MFAGYDRFLLVLCISECVPLDDKQEHFILHVIIGFFRGKKESIVSDIPAFITR